MIENKNRDFKRGLKYILLFIISIAVLLVLAIKIVSTSTITTQNNGNILIVDEKILNEIKKDIISEVLENVNNTTETECDYDENDICWILMDFNNPMAKKPLVSSYFRF